jgi:hypothetical protein
MVGKIGRRGRGVVGVLGVMAMTGVAFAQPVGADDGATVDAVTVVEDLLGNQTAGGVVAAGGDTAVVVATAGTVVDVPTDPTDGIAVDLAGSGADVAITPLDPGLDDFARDGAMATAGGDGYATVVQPLVGGDLRLAVTLDDPSAPRSLSYDLDLPEGTQVIQRPDGGFDFVAVDGTLTGGLAAPWAIDANGNPVSVSYHHDGNGRITRHILTDADTAYPVIANFCIFGKNPNGSCRNPIRGSWDAIRKAASWAYDSVIKKCAKGAVVTVIGTGASFAVTNIARTVAGKALMAMPGGGYAYLGVAAMGCVAEVLG